MRLRLVVPTKSTGIELLAQESMLKRRIGFLANVPIESIAQVDLRIIDFKIVVFCDGCYWHACPECGFDQHIATRKRDLRITEALQSKGWTVVRVWEHMFKSDPDIVGKIISAQLSEDYLAALLRQQEKEVVR